MQISMEHQNYQGGNNSLIGKIQTVNLLNTKTVTFTGNSILFSIDLQYTVKSSYTDYMYSKYHLFMIK